MFLTTRFVRTRSQSSKQSRRSQFAPAPLRLADPAARAVTGAHISLEADMPHAGMAASLGEAKEIAPGRYQASLTLEMAGDWVILLHVTLPDGQELERQIGVRGVRPN